MGGAGAATQPARLAAVDSGSVKALRARHLVKSFEGVDVLLLISAGYGEDDTVNPTSGVGSSAFYLAPRDKGDAWSEELAASGQQGAQRLLGVSQVIPPREKGLALNLADEPVVLRRRLMLAGDRPVEVTDSYYPASCHGRGDACGRTTGHRRVVDPGERVQSVPSRAGRGHTPALRPAPR
ncbi:hypothetical protein Ssi02_58040 [Sinosporangium siamense]|uniref:Uncharacterized protein n=1 Tax=Sinosporangium siamense TaxID=1367973 RepID=A0A919RL34_9ACTN|nr:hypothetical protein Ssi02_58040 [Sinosporangium siamense]